MAEGQPQMRCSLRFLFLHAGAVTLLLVIAGVSLPVAACTTPYKHPQLWAADAGFAGIDDSFGPQTPEVDVLLIHGMGTHNEQWVQSMVNQLAPALGFFAPADLPLADALKHGAKLEGGRQIREAIQDAMLRSLSTEGMSLEQPSAGATPTAKTAPLFRISESLGSKIVADSLQQFETKPRSTAHAYYIQNSPVANAIAHGSGAMTQSTGAHCAQQ